MKNQLLFLSLAAALFAGCSKDADALEGSNTPQGEFVSVTLPVQATAANDTPPSAMAKSVGGGNAMEGFSVSFDQAMPASGDATPATRTIASELANVWVLQFDSAGQNVSTTNTGTLAAGAYLTAPSLQVGTGYTICIVANGTASGLTTTNPATLTAFESTMLHTDAVTDAAKLPLGGKLTGVTVVNMGDGKGKISLSSSAPATILMKRIQAEVTLTVDFGVTGYTLTGAELYNVPIGATYGWNSATTTFPVNTVAANFGYTDLTAAGLTPVTTSTSGTKTTYNWFIGDNRRGDVVGLAAQSDRNSTKAPAYATFARITIKGTGTIMYDVYLGSGAVTNFDVKRNMTYTQTAAIKGSAALHEALAGVDLRVSKRSFILTVDDNGILTVDGKMLFFQFGSVVCFTQEGAWGADKVLFNPVTGSPSYATYTSIPVYTSADFDAGRTNISATTYHNGTNVKAGKGDPCRLVGLTAGQVQSMTAAQLDAYNSGWRLPTIANNQSFTGVTGGVSYSAHWTASDSRYDNWYYSTGSAGGYFPIGQESQKKNYLPAAGYRSTDGVSSAGSQGYYWSGEAKDGGIGYYLYLSSSAVSPIGNNNCTKGFGARCVMPSHTSLGDLKDGGIVYWVDAADTENYKVFSLTQGSGLKWAAADTYVLGAGDGQDETDGKKNMSAMKAYFDANKGTVGSIFSVAFPAAGFCDAMNTGGVSGWYLPAKDELVALHTAYMANKAVLDKALTDNSGTAMAGSVFCSGTENSDDSSSAWFVSFLLGNPTVAGKSHGAYVRCVREN